MAFLREGGGLWSLLFGRKHLNISALVYWPKFGGGKDQWHFCAASMTPCDWLGRAKTC